MTTTERAPRPGKTTAERPRRLPVGAEPAPGGGVHFRVWAPRPRGWPGAPGPAPGGGFHFRVWPPRRKKVEVFYDPPGAAGASAELSAGGDGSFWAPVPGAGPGTRSRYRLDGGAPFPDPAS